MPTGHLDACHLHVASRRTERTHLSGSNGNKCQDAHGDQCLGHLCELSAVIWEEQSKLSVCATGWNVCRGVARYIPPLCHVIRELGTTLPGQEGDWMAICQGTPLEHCGKPLAYLHAKHQGQQDQLGKLGQL